TIAQALLITLVIFVRASTIWIPLGLMVYCAILLARRARQGHGLSSTWRQAWPLAALLTVLILCSIALRSSLDDTYKRSGDLGHHTIWHPIYYSLQTHPEWNAKYGASHGNAIGDEQPRA